MFSFLFKKYIDQGRAQGRAEAYREFQVNEKESNDIKRQSEIIRLQQFVGKLVIVVPNEIANLTVAYAKNVAFISQANDPILVVEDVVTTQEVFVFGKIFAYTPEKFHALNSLTSEQRIELLYYSEKYNLPAIQQPDHKLYSSSEWEHLVQLGIELFKVKQQLFLNK